MLPALLPTVLKALTQHASAGALAPLSLKLAVVPSDGGTVPLLPAKIEAPPSPLPAAAALASAPSPKCSSLLSPCGSPASPPPASIDYSRRCELVKQRMADILYSGDDPHAFVKSGGVKYRSRTHCCVQGFKCSTTGCPATRTLRVRLDNDQEEWVAEGAHTDHAVLPQRTHPTVKKRVHDALALGGLPAVVSHNLTKSTVDSTNPLAPLPTTLVMTKKQCTNAKAYMAYKTVGPADFAQLCSRYDEIREPTVAPLRVPFIAKWAATYLGSREHQFYIDTTFKLITAHLLLTPLLVALPPLDPANRKTPGPVIPIAFYIHEGQSADDYKFFLKAVKKACGGILRPACFHRDYDDAIAKGIRDVCTALCTVLPWHSVTDFVLGIQEDRGQAMRRLVALSACKCKVDARKRHGRTAYPRYRQGHR